MAEETKTKEEKKQNVKIEDPPAPPVSEDSQPMIKVKMSVPVGLHSFNINGNEIKMDKGATHIEIPPQFIDDLLPFGFKPVFGEGEAIISSGKKK